MFSHILRLHLGAIEILIPKEKMNGITELPALCFVAGRALISYFAIHES